MREPHAGRREHVHWPTYEEYDLDGTRVAMIADPTNEHAWMQSDLTVPVDP